MHTKPPYPITRPDGSPTGYSYAIASVGQAHRSLHVYDTDGVQVGFVSAAIAPWLDTHPYQAWLGIPGDSLHVYRGADGMTALCAVVDASEAR